MVDYFKDLGKGRRRRLNLQLVENLDLGRGFSLNLTG